MVEVSTRSFEADSLELGQAPSIQNEGVYTPGVILRPILLSLCLLSGACLTPSKFRPLYTPFGSDLKSWITQNPLPAGEEIRITDLHRSEFASLHLVQLRGRIRAHFHREHAETIYFLEGEGTMEIAGEKQTIAAGSVQHLSPGWVHSFETKPETNCVALVIFTPPFDGEDRIFLESK